MVKINHCQTLLHAPSGLSLSLPPSQTWPYQGWSHVSSISRRHHSPWGYPLDHAGAGPWPLPFSQRISFYYITTYLPTAWGFHWLLGTPMLTCQSGQMLLDLIPRVFLETPLNLWLMGLIVWIPTAFLPTGCSNSRVLCWSLDIRVLQCGWALVPPVVVTEMVINTTYCSSSPLLFSLYLLVVYWGSPQSRLFTPPCYKISL